MSGNGQCEKGSPKGMLWPQCKSKEEGAQRAGMERALAGGVTEEGNENLSKSGKRTTADKARNVASPLLLQTLHRE